MNYGSAKSTFEGFLNLTSHSSALNDTFFSLALTRILRQLKVPAIEKSAVLTAGTSSDFTIPSDYLSIRRLVTSDRQLDYKSPAFFKMLDGDLSEPYFYTRDVGKFIVAGTIAEGGTITCVYHSTDQAMVNNSDEPPILVKAPDLVIWGALCVAADYYENETRGDRWEAKFNSLLQEVYYDGLDDLMQSHLAIEPATTCEY